MRFECAMGKSMDFYMVIFHHKKPLSDTGVLDKGWDGNEMKIFN